MEERIACSDVVVTGEGCFDEQTANGKVCQHVMDLCRKHSKKCYIVCGIAKAVPPPGVTLLSLTEIFGKEEALKNPASCLQKLELN